MISTVIFDIGNVLVDFRWKDYLKDFGYSEEVCKKVAANTIFSPIWDEFDRGRLSDEEIISHCIQGAPDCEKEIVAFYKNIEYIVKEYEYAPTWVQSLKNAGYQILVLSNYPRTGFSYAKKNFKFLQYIDGGVISYEVLSVKPEPEIYKALIDKYNLVPEQCAFLDDREDNIEAGHKFGFNTIHFKTQQQAAKDLDTLILA